MNFKEYIGKMIYVIVNGFPYGGVLESEDNESLTLIGEYSGLEVLFVIPKIMIDLVIIPTGKSNE
jgi:hypothetical protein